MTKAEFQDHVESSNGYDARLVRATRLSVAGIKAMFESHPDLEALHNALKAIRLEEIEEIAFNKAKEGNEKMINYILTNHEKSIFKEEKKTASPSSNGVTINLSEIKDARKKALEG